MALLAESNGCGEAAYASANDDYFEVLDHCGVLYLLAPCFRKGCEERCDSTGVGAKLYFIGGARKTALQC